MANKQKAKRVYYCGSCGQWFRAASQSDIRHNHPQFEPYFMLCRPVDLIDDCGSYIGVKPLSSGKWRAMLIHIIEGYSDHPVWGHEAGQCLHYEYEAMRDENGSYIEAGSEGELTKKLASEYKVEKYFVSLPSKFPIVECD